MLLLVPVLLALLLSRQVTTYRGSTYGVRAEVGLDEGAGVALLKLDGIPVGHVEGLAWFGDGGDVRLSEKLEEKFARRRIKVVSVKRAEDKSTVSVTVRVVGFTLSLSLEREEDGRHGAPGLGSS
tara:strand:+ start:128 stop:502 length:375 start_codon:yes stop_codon:yes gene_type:complete